MSSNPEHTESTQAHLNPYNIQPLADLVVIKRDKPKDLTSGGIWLAPASQDKLSTGIVVAVGPGKYKKGNLERIPMEVKPGDHVLFSKFVNQDCAIPGEDLLTMHEADIVGLIDDAADMDKFESLEPNPHWEN